MTIQEKLYTAEDLWELSQGDNAKRFELVKGELVEVSPSGDIATTLAILIGHFLLEHVIKHDLGDVTVADGGYQLFGDPDTVRAPDVAFVAKTRLGPMTGKFYPYGPDLAVEVVLPSNSATDINDKTIEYLNAGIRQVWIVYPKSRTI